MSATHVLLVGPRGPLPDEVAAAIVDAITARFVADGDREG